MALDVPVPEPPSLSGPQTEGAYNAVEPPDMDGVDDYRRDELEAALADGVWAEGFEAWLAGTALTESEFALLVRHGVFDQFDFYWDPATEAVGYHVPNLSDDAREALSTDTGEVASELESLARVVAATLEREGFDREG